LHVIDNTVNRWCYTLRIRYNDQEKGGDDMVKGRGT
jgi:hypothetical protein